LTLKPGDIVIIDNLGVFDGSLGGFAQQRLELGEDLFDGAGGTPDYDQCTARGRTGVEGASQ
jgi:hypothetical protein